VVLAATEVPPVPGDALAEVLRRERSFSWSDRSSRFRIHINKRFLQEPLGLSGRSIEDGFWWFDDGSVRVAGRWSWQNGKSRPDDFRLMQFQLNYNGEPLEEDPMGSFYPVYFVVESLEKISPERYEELCDLVGWEPAGDGHLTKPARR
jgi:hypothetical protein